MAYARTTLTTLRARLLERVGGHQKFWVQAELDYALNEALAAWNLLTGDLIDSENKTGVSAGTENFTLDADAILPFRITAKDGTIILAPTTLQDLDQGEYGWRDDANGTPAFWAVSGGDLVWIWPQPDATAVSGTNDFSIGFYDGGQQLVNAGDYIQVGDEDLNAILNYAQAYLAFKEGPKEGTELADALQQMFVAVSKRRANWLVGQNPFMAYTVRGRQAGETTLDGEVRRG